MSSTIGDRDVVRSLFSQGPLGMLRASQKQHPHLNQNIQKLENFVNIHSEKPHSQTGFDKLPSEIFGMILSFAGVGHIPTLAVLNNLCYENFENEDSLVYKLLLQAMMKKDDKYMEDIREKFGLTYRSSLKQSIGRIKRPYTASGNELFDASYMFNLDMDERESPKAEIVNMKADISLVNFSLEMWCKLKQHVSGDLLVIYTSSKNNQVKLTLTTSALYLVVNDQSNYVVYMPTDTWQHMAIDIDKSMNIRVRVSQQDSFYEFPYVNLPFHENDLNIGSISLWEGVNMCADFTELRVWNTSRSIEEIKELADMRINPFLKSLNYENLIYYFYPNSQDGDTDQLILNKTPNMDIEQQAKLEIKNFQLRKLQSKQANFFEDLCAIL